MPCFKFFVLILFASYSHGKTSHPKCSITLPSDVPKNEPLYLHHTNAGYILFKPTGQETTIQRSRPLSLFCPGKNNKLKIGSRYSDHIIEANCKTNSNNNRFESEIGEFFLENVNCTKSVRIDHRSNNAKCANHNTGVLHQIGFQVSPVDLIPVYDVCFDGTTASAIWSKHTINGNAIKFSIKENGRKDFKLTGLPAKLDPGKYYKKTAQLQHFRTVLGSSQNYFNSNSYLARGHLSPDADFIFPSGQFATYFYINVCPQFQTVNAGNWLRVESLIRKLAQHSNTELIIYTGVYEQLHLLDENRQLKPLYLTVDNKIEVPKWIWKVVKNDDTDSAIVLITSNNPYADGTDVDEFCRNVCHEANLHSKHFQNTRKGYTFCCELNDFKSIVKTLPAQLHASRLINFATISDE